MTIPRIGITGVVRTWDGAERAGVNGAYVRAVIAAGGVPLVLPPLIDPSRAADLLDGLDGLLFTGGEDIDPALYNECPSPLLHTVSRPRDLFELALLAAARERRIPILGICRGIQLVTVALGGTLYQDLASERGSEIKHDGTAARDLRTHGVKLEPGSRVAAAIGADTLQVNSVHHQGVKDLPPSLRATAWAEDGLIEAVESEPDTGWLLAVQWHPEEFYAEEESLDAGIFRALIQEAARRPGSVDAEIAEHSVG